MCGIAGLMTLDGKPPPTPPLRAMEAVLRHRGPDGVGQYRSGDTGMMQTRLAIIDLATGAQPLYEPGGAALIANAEIYNYIELRDELRSAARPIAFSTQSDCELPLHLYRRHGLDFTQHLRGMHAIALHDPAARRLVLARDPFGIKPLYYTESTQGFAFASEPQALIEAGLVAPKLLRRARDELIQMQFTTGRETIFAGINRVSAGRDGNRVSRADCRAPAARGVARIRPGRSWRRRGVRQARCRARRQRAHASALGRAVRVVLIGRDRFDRDPGDDGASRRASRSRHLRLGSTMATPMSGRQRGRRRGRLAPSMSKSRSVRLIFGDCCRRSCLSSTIRPPITPFCRPGCWPAPRAKPASR